MLFFIILIWLLFGLFGMYLLGYDWCNDLNTTIDFDFGTVVLTLLGSCLGFVIFLVANLILLSDDLFFEFYKQWLPSKPCYKIEKVFSFNFPLNFRKRK